MTDPIIEAAVRDALARKGFFAAQNVALAQLAVNAATPLITARARAEALENAAKVAECFIAANGRPTAYNDPIAALIRFLIPAMPANDSADG